MLIFSYLYSDEKAKIDKEKLLALRAQNPKSNKAAKLMKSRTKDNDFSIIKLTEDEEILKKKVNIEMHRKETLDKLQRMKLRIELENQGRETLANRKRKHKPKDGIPDDNINDIQLFDHEKKHAVKNEEPVIRVKRRRHHHCDQDLIDAYSVGTHLKKHEKRKVASASNRAGANPPPKMDFSSLLQLATKLQHKPVEIKVEKPVDERPMTKKERKDSSFCSSSQSRFPAKSNEPNNKLRMNRIPKKSSVTCDKPRASNGKVHSSVKEDPQSVPKLSSGKIPKIGAGNHTKNYEKISSKKSSFKPIVKKTMVNSSSIENQQSNSKQSSKNRKIGASFRKEDCEPSSARSASLPEKKIAVRSSKSASKIHETSHKCKVSRDELQSPRSHSSKMHGSNLKDKSAKHSSENSQGHKTRESDHKGKVEISAKSKAMLPSKHSLKSDSVAAYKMAKASREDVPQYKTSPVKLKQSLPSYSTNKQSKKCVSSKDSIASYSTGNSIKEPIPSNSDRHFKSNFPKKTVNRPPSPGSKFRNAQRNPMSLKQKRIINSDDEYDEQMADFIDDGPDEGLDYSAHIKEIFGYDKSK